MRASQWESRLTVVECRRLPGVFVMADKTSLREIPLDMIWVIGVDKITLMATVTIARKTMNLVINVTRYALYIYMSPA
jgi:hypothetical protein